MILFKLLHTAIKTEVHYHFQMVTHQSLALVGMAQQKQEADYSESMFLFGVQPSMHESDYTTYHYIHEHPHQRTLSILPLLLYSSPGFCPPQTLQTTSSLDIVL